MTSLSPTGIVCDGCSKTKIASTSAYPGMCQETLGSADKPHVSQRSIAGALGMSVGLTFRHGGSVGRLEPRVDLRKRLKLTFLWSPIITVERELRIVG